NASRFPSAQARRSCVVSELWESAIRSGWTEIISPSNFFVCHSGFSFPFAPEERPGGNNDEDRGDHDDDATGECCRAPASDSEPGRTQSGGLSGARRDRPGKSVGG